MCVSLQRNRGLPALPKPSPPSRSVGSVDHFNSQHTCTREQGDRPFLKLGTQYRVGQLAQTGLTTSLFNTVPLQLVACPFPPPVEVVFHRVCSNNPPLSPPSLTLLSCSSTSLALDCHRGCTTQLPACTLIPTALCLSVLHDLLLDSCTNACTSVDVIHQQCTKKQTPSHLNTNILKYSHKSPRCCTSANKKG